MQEGESEEEQKFECSVCHMTFATRNELKSI